MTKLRTTLLSLATLLLGAVPVLASAACDPTSGLYCNPIPNITTVPCLLLAIVDLIFLIGVPIIVMFIIYSGFLFVTAGGNETKISSARTAFMWTLLGALVLLGAKAIALAIGTTIFSLGGPDALPILVCS